jgi:hypothetical protein
MSPRATQPHPYARVIWIIGACVWLGDGLIAMHYRSPQHAELAFLLAGVFTLAWWFYRAPRKP